MGDYLVNLGANQTVRSAIKKIGLPIPLPQKLNRVKKAWSERPLADKPIFVCHGSTSFLAPFLAETLPRAGADTWVVGSNALLETYQKCGEPWGRHPNKEIPPDIKPHGLVFDATGIRDPKALSSVYDFFHAHIRNLAPCGRAIILAEPPEVAKEPMAAAGLRALDGFIRSLAREIGKRGSTAHLVVVEGGAESRIGPVVTFLLSSSSAYISGQQVRVSNASKCEPAPFSRKSLESKVALVTGAARGIGASIASVLAREGAHVICMDRPSELDSLNTLAGNILGTAFEGDITDDNVSSRLLQLLKDKFHGGLDIVVHNAGITRDKTLANMKSEYWEQTLDVNLISLIKLNEALLPLIRTDGRIVCVSSVTGIAGNMGQTNYSASKAGIIGYVKALAPTVEKKGINVNAVAPGFIETKMTAGMPKGMREVARRLCNLVQGGMPEDVAETVTFLATKSAAGLTGEVLRICGGSYLGA